MSAFRFFSEKRPFPRWLGPFSPARGNHSGFRFHGGRLGTWANSDYGMTFWPVVENAATQELEALVREDWGGGRILLLPNGFVVKPLSGDNEAGERRLIGRFSGAITLATPQGRKFDMSKPGSLSAGDPWTGPPTTGLECTIQSDGSLSCQWYFPTALGRDSMKEQLRGPDRALAAGLRAARPGQTACRVKITENGHVITNRNESDESWVSVYVGHVDPAKWQSWDKWIEGDE